ncbi:MAG TPA: methyltransferase domain-containing protein [Candidatus Saccharimonadales bacterium]|nr:methyltransferase domain-containing protein [Candidatus Saccharimonadales bacterium]
MIVGSRRHFFKFLLAISLLLAGCARLKQCAYEGVARDDWQQPQKVIAALKIQPGSVVADLGSGGGYFTFKLAEAVGPTGKVYAIDIDQDMINLITKTAKERAAGNIEPVLAKPNDPMLPKTGADLIFTSNTYHHIDNRVAYFASLRRYLRPGGSVAIIDFDRRAWLEGLLRHYTPTEFIKREMEQAGYRLREEFDFLDRQSFLVFAPKS